MVNAIAIYLAGRWYSAIARFGISAVGLATLMVSIGQPKALKLKITAPSRQDNVVFSKAGWSIFWPLSMAPSALSAKVPRVGHVGLKGCGGKKLSCSPGIGAGAFIPPPTIGAALKLAKRAFPRFAGVASAPFDGMPRF